MLCQYNKSFPGQRLYLLDVAAGAKSTDCGHLVAVDFSLFLPEHVIGGFLGIQPTSLTLVHPLGRVKSAHWGN